MRATLFILVLMGISLSGCGTLSDRMCGPIDGHTFYRGVRMDVAAVREGGPLAVMAADIPFSAVADTMRVPFLAFDAWNAPPREKRATMTDERSSDPTPDSTASRSSH